MRHEPHVAAINQVATKTKRSRQLSAEPAEPVQVAAAFGNVRQGGICDKTRYRSALHAVTSDREI